MLCDSRIWRAAPARGTAMLRSLTFPVSRSMSSACASQAQTTADSRPPFLPLPFTSPPPGNTAGMAAAAPALMLTLRPAKCCPPQLQEETPDLALQGPGIPWLQEAFEDVALYFTQKEWELLEDRDKMLYQDQMLRNYQALVSLGYQGPAPDLICRIHRGEVELWVYEDEGHGERTWSEGLSPGSSNTEDTWYLLEEENSMDLFLRSGTSLHAAGARILNPAEEEPEPVRNQLPMQCAQKTIEPQKSPVQRPPRSHEDNIHSREVLYICGECGKSFSDEQELELHGRTHSKVLAHSCGQCGKSFRYRYRLVEHQRTHSGERPHLCLECGKTYARLDHLRVHQRVHTGEKPYRCTQCEKSFNHLFHLQVHQRVHTGEKPYHCRDCGKSFNDPSYLRVHQRLHTGEQPYHCAVCGKNFSQSSSLAKHQLVHSTERMHHCGDCGKSFNNPYYFRVHQRVHTGEKPHPCPQCQKSFNNLSYLRVHLRLHTGEKPYGCSECGRNFRHRTSLINHQRVHTGEKPYCCNECGMSFRISSSLTNHLRVHTGEKPYGCAECGMSFRHSSSLTDHQRLHTGEKPYHCVQCGLSFRHSSSLTNHQGTHGPAPHDSHGSVSATTSSSLQPVPCRKMSSACPEMTLSLHSSGTEFAWS